MKSIYKFSLTITEEMMYEIEAETEAQARDMLKSNQAGEFYQGYRQLEKVIELKKVVPILEEVE